MRSSRMALLDRPLKAKLGGLFLNGFGGNYANSLDHNDFDVTDLDVRCAVALDDWTPAGGIQTLISKRQTAGQFSFQFRVNTNARLSLVWSADGTATIAIDSSTAPTVSDKAALLVRATLDVDNGAAGNDVKFYTKPYNRDTVLADLLSNSGWTQLGTTVTSGGTTSIFASSSWIEIGTILNGSASSAMWGRHLGAVIKNGIDGTTVFAADFTAQRPGTKSFVESTGKAVSINGSAFVDRYETGGTLRSLRLPGSSGNYASTPDAAALDLSTELDIRLRCAVDDWTPSAASVLLAKENGAGARSYRFSLNTTGSLGLVLSDDGTATTTVSSGANVAFTDGTAHWVRVTWRASDGRVQFFVSEDGTTWTQNGTNQTIAYAGIFNSNAPVEIGSRIAGTAEVLTGRVMRAIVKSTIDGTSVLDADFNRPIGEASFVESTGKTITLNGNARYAYEG